jgi:hypothetical protein
MGVSMLQCTCVDEKLACSVEPFVGTTHLCMFFCHGWDSMKVGCWCSVGLWLVFVDVWEERALQLYMFEQDEVWPVKVLY